MLDLSADFGRDLRLSPSDSASELDAEIRAEQARLFWSQAYLLVGLGIGVGIALAVAQWPVIDHGVIAAWLALLILVSAVSAALVYVFHWRVVPGNASTAWIRYGAGIALIHGVTWGTAALLLFPDEPFAHQAMLTVMLSGISAGAVTVLSSISVAGVAFVVPALLPVAYQFALERTTSALLILAMLLVFLLTLVLANRHLYKTLFDNLRLRIEKGHSEAALYESESRYRLMFNQSPLGVLHYDVGGAILDCNDMLVEILGSSRRAIVGSNMIDEAGDEKMARAVRTSLETGWAYYEDTYEPVSGVHTVPLRGFFNAVTGVDEEIVGGVGIVEDFTQRKRAEEEIHRRAYYDALTDLPNRRLLLDRLERALSAAERHGRYGALLFLDLDYFKRVNDWLGHASGDEVLRGVSERLLAVLRAEDTVARLSGDEFIVLLPYVADDAEHAQKGAATVSKKLQRALQEPLEVAGYDMRLTASIGITIFPREGATADDLLRHSDTAMYRAKKEVRGEIRFYQATADAADEGQAALEHDLQFALERDELHVLYQPIVDADGRGVAAEALLRWQHGLHGTVPPSRFVPLAEESGLIIPMGRWTLGQVFRRIRQLDAAGHNLQLAVNVSAREFHHSAFVRYVEQLLERSGIDGRQLVLEVTENVLIDRLDVTIRKIERLRRHGIAFAVDDFGTGYSSLTYLKRLPVDAVKIDQGFVRDLETDPSDAAIVEAIVAIAHRLDLYVVAEGVERASQRDYLLEQGCDRFQGYLWARPAPFEQIFRRRSEASQ